MQTEAKAAPVTNPEQPFPLKQQFRRRFIPAFIGFAAVFLLLVAYGGKTVVESIYLELAQRRAQAIAASVSEQATTAWGDLMSGRSLRDISHPGEAARLADAFDREVREQKLPELKVYDLGRRVLYATIQSEIGSREDGDALRQVISTSAPGIVTKRLDDGTHQYELYVPVFDTGGTLRTVFELYEPVDYLDALLLDAAIPIITIPGILLLGLAFALGRLVNRAQIDIDQRTEALNVLRRRIETFVSSTAADAAYHADGSGNIPSKKLTTTLFFSDIRDFTGFSERNTPEAVVEMLNRLMTLQVDIIRRHGGDIDKMIGDAVLARFDGDTGAVQAMEAAEEIQKAVRKGDFPRGIGIGIYRGEVISGAIGPANRRDFTVIGDSVNVAARLCSEAGSGEIVISADLANTGFGIPETVSVKGRSSPLAIHRYRVG